MYEYKADLDRVVDGDTIDVQIDLGFKMTTHQRIRFAHIDTPEIFRVPKDSPEYRRGLKAKKYVARRLKKNGSVMRLETYKWPGRYGRYTANVWLKDSPISLNDELVKKGLAKRIRDVKAKKSLDA